MKIQPVTIAGTQYNIAEASALNQKTLMTLVAGKIAFNSATSQQDIDVKFLVGTLLTTPEDVLDKIATIVLHQTIQSGGSELVTIDNFQGGMMSYFELIAEGIKVNLQDFFTYLDNENKSARLESKPSQ